MQLTWCVHEGFPNRFQDNIIFAYRWRRKQKVYHFQCRLVECPMMLDCHNGMKAEHKLFGSHYLLVQIFWKSQEIKHPEMRGSIISLS